MKLGRFVMLTVRIDGVQQQRAYSLVNSSNSSTLELGVKRHGHVSRYVTHPARLGGNPPLLQGS